MTEPVTADPPASYFGRLARNVVAAVAQLLDSPSEPRAAEAARKFRRDALILIATGAIAVAALMYWVDFPEIRLMPPRNAPNLWPVRILTDFGKAAFVMWTIAALLLAVTLATPAVREGLRPRLLRLMTELEFLVLAVLVPIMAGEIVKWIVGRGRPFVGPDPFTFSHFAGTSAYASFPSAHSITAVALAFAVSALWPKLRGLMIVYALLIIASRLVLLAHHPSDVVAGAIFGMIGAMAVRRWFAARRLGFRIGHDGAILPPAGPDA